MRRAAAWTLVFGLLGCGSDEESPAEQAPAPPPPPAVADAHAPIVPLLPDGTFLYIEVASCDELDRVFFWYPLMLGRSLPAQLAGRGLPRDLLDPARPVAFALRSAVFGDVMSVAAAPVRDAKEALSKLGERRATVFLGEGYAGWSENASYRPARGAPPIAAALPPGVVRGRVDIAALVKLLEEGPAAAVTASFAAGLPPSAGKGFEDLRSWFRTLDALSWSLNRDGEALVVDAALTAAGDAEPAPPGPPLEELLRLLPPDAQVVMAGNLDFAAAAEVLGPLFALGQALDPTVEDAGTTEAWSCLGRGFATSFRCGEQGIEMVLVARARDPDRFLRVYGDTVRAQAALAGARIRIEALPEAVVAGAKVVTLRLHPVFDADDPRERLFASPLDRPVLAFRAGGDAARRPADWAERDRANVRARLRAATGEAFEVSGDDEYLFVEMPRFSLGDPDGVHAAAAARRALGRQGHVRFRRAVHPGHATYAAYRGMLERTLAGAGGAPAAVYRIGPENRADADVQAGTFPSGLAWIRLAEGADTRIHASWRHRGYLLVALDEREMSQADLLWAYVSHARLGDGVPDRDVAFCVKDEGGPLRALAHGEGTHFLVVVIDGEVFAGVRIEGPAGAYGAFEGLTADDAALLAQALGHPPLWATYADEGQKPYAFRRAREMRAGFVRVFGEEYLAARVGALDDLVFVALGSRAGLTEETVAVLRKGGRPLPPGLATSLGHAPGAGFLLRVDLGALVDGFAAMMSAFMGERMPDMGLSLPDGLEPALLAGWGEGEGIRARLRLDGRLFAHFEEQERELRLKRAASQVEGMHEMVLDWRKETGATGLPGPDEPFFGYQMREDPWGTEVRIEGGAGGDVRVTSAGPDGVFDTDDDISAPPK